MKKILSIFAAVSLLAVLVLPTVSLAIDPGETLKETCILKNDIGTVGTAACGAAKSVPVVGSGSEGICCMLDTIYTVTNWIFYIMTLVAVLMIIFGGFTYVTAAGDPAKAGKGKTILTYAIIGLAIALVAKLVPSLVKFIVGT